MKPVEQRGDSDCVIACLASILELPYEAIPAEIAMFETQSEAVRAFLKTRGLAPWDVQLWGDDSPMLMFGSERIEYHFMPGGFWIAGVGSPRLTNDDGSPGEHAVVMLGHRLVYDPHPLRAMGHLGFRNATMILPHNGFSPRAAEGEER